MSWQPTFRQHFPVLRDLRYANVAYTSPLAPVVSEAIGAFLASITYARSDKPLWLREADTCRSKIARLINGHARQVAFTKNTCEALNLVAQGLRWRPGENLVTNDQEHPSSLLPWLNLRDRGVEVRVVRARNREIVLDELLANIDNNTRVVAVSWVQSTSGQRLDLKTLSAVCRARGIRLVVDAIQGLGLLDLDLTDTPIDALASGAHKGLLGPLGIGFVHLSKLLLDELEPAYLGPSAVTQIAFDGEDYSPDYKDRLDARRLETGNINYVGVAGLTRALDLILAAKPNRIEPWVTSLSLAFAGRLRASGIDVITPAGDTSNTTGPITTIRVQNALALNVALREANVIASVVERDYARFAFGAYNTTQDMDSIADIVLQHVK
ncbi:Cysteine desulfurase [Paraburkholderia unamae]|nr:Cysteine desulfurase [Paraburkholderia unamae]